MAPTRLFARKSSRGERLEGWRMDNIKKLNEDLGDGDGSPRQGLSDGEDEVKGESEVASPAPSVGTPRRSETSPRPKATEFGQPKTADRQCTSVDYGLDDDNDDEVVDDDDASLADEASLKVWSAYQRWRVTKIRLNGIPEQHRQQQQRQAPLPFLQHLQQHQRQQQQPANTNSDSIFSNLTNTFSTVLGNTSPNVRNDVTTAKDGLRDVSHATQDVPSSAATRKDGRGDATRTVKDGRGKATRIAKTAPSSSSRNARAQPTP